MIASRLLTQFRVILLQPYCISNKIKPKKKYNQSIYIFAKNKMATRHNYFFWLLVLLIRLYLMLLLQWR